MHAWTRPIEARPGEKHAPFSARKGIEHAVCPGRHHAIVCDRAAADDMLSAMEAFTCSRSNDDDGENAIAGLPLCLLQCELRSARDVRACPSLVTGCWAAALAVTSWPCKVGCRTKNKPAAPVLVQCLGLRNGLRTGVGATTPSGNPPPPTPLPPQKETAQR